MQIDDMARLELATFLRTKRLASDPAALGLPAVGYRRTSGLRREEVAMLSSVSLTWYTWLEQARAENPSRQVISAVAKALRLTPAEHHYTLRLSGHFDEAPKDEAIGSDTGVLSSVSNFLDVIHGIPAFGIDLAWNIVAWNAAYEHLYPNVAETNSETRNLLWLVFTDPYVRELLADWSDDSWSFLAEFRADVSARLADPACTELVNRLTDSSEHFRKGWDQYLVQNFSSRPRRFQHPEVGALEMTDHRLSLADCPNVRVIVYVPAVHHPTVEKLSDLCETEPRVDADVTFGVPV